MYKERLYHIPIVKNLDIPAPVRAVVRAVVLSEVRSVRAAVRKVGTVEVVVIVAATGSSRKIVEVTDLNGATVVTITGSEVTKSAKTQYICI